MKLLNKKCFLFILTGVIFIAVKSDAQKIDTVSTFSISAYVDAYYAHYTDSVGPGNFQKWPNTSPRSDNPSLNTAMVSFLYNADKIRGAAVFSFGDFAACTWAPAPFNNVMEAHVGVKIYSKLWLDAGLFRTHFGTEYLLPVENLASSITVGTFYEPPFESAVKLNFAPTSKLEINLFLLNGYGMFVDNNNKKSAGMGITYAFMENSSVGYTNYLGDDTPPGFPGDHLRSAHNVFVSYQKKKIKVLAGADYCFQKNSDILTNTKTASMYSAMATVKYQAAKRAAVYGRGEVFGDPDGVMSTIITDRAGKKTGYKLWGATLGFEFKPTDESYVRIENRIIQMDKDQYIFMKDATPQNMRYEVMVNAGVTFELLKNVMNRKGD